MAAQLKISADTTPVKKSILDLNKSIKDLGDSKISLFSNEERDFIKRQMNQEMSAMKKKLKENQTEIQRLVSSQKKMTEGSEEELKTRKQIIEAYQKQTRLAKEMGQLQQGGAGGGGRGGGGMMGMLGRGIGAAGMAIGGGALALAGYGLYKGVQSSGQYVRGAPRRTQLQGLGISDQNLGTPEQLARTGLSEQELIQRTVQATRTLGRQGGGTQAQIQQAGFERAFGLGGGTMTNVATSLRGILGGEGANEAQMKLQASILASGIEDAIGPYLEAATDLLASINENGLTATDEMIQMFGQLAEQGDRTPEQIAQAFQGIDAAIRQSTGEQNAFLQTAFAREGIGGGTIGATRLALESGGMFGLSREELQERGYNQQLIEQMQGQGFFGEGGGGRRRMGAILGQFRRSAGMDPNQSFGEITDVDQMTGISRLANSILGTQGLGGFDALQLMERAQAGQVGADEFRDEFRKIQEGESPQLQRLDKINETLAGQTEVLTLINENLMESLGEEAVRVRNQAARAEAAALRTMESGASAVNRTGAVEGIGGFINNPIDYLSRGQLGEDIAGFFEREPEQDTQRNMGGGFIPGGIENLRPDTTSEVDRGANIPSSMTRPQPEAISAGMEAPDKMQQEQIRALKQIATNTAAGAGAGAGEKKITVNNKIRLGDGRVVNKTHR